MVRRAGLLLGLLSLAQDAASLAVTGRVAFVGSTRAAMSLASAAAPTLAAWPDLTDEPVLYPEAAAARTVIEVCTVATLSTTSSTDGVNGALCARVVAGAPSNTQAVRLLGAAEQLYVIDTDGCPIFGLREGSQAASDLAAASRASFSAHAVAGSAQAGCGVTLVGAVSAHPELHPDLMKKLVKRTGIGAEELAARAWLKLEPEHVHLTDALRSSEAWVAVGEYAAAEPNPLAEDLAEVMKKINADFTKDLARLAAMLTDSDEEATAGSEVAHCPTPTHHCCVLQLGLPFDQTACAVKILTGHTHTHTERENNTPDTYTRQEQHHIHTTRTTPQTPKRAPPTNT